MKKLLLVLLTIFALTMFAYPALALNKAANQPPIKTQAEPCDVYCDAGSLLGMWPWDFLWDGVHDVSDLDIQYGGLSPASISGRAWTRANDGHNTGLNADMLDGRHKGYFTSKINTLNARNKKLNRRVTVLSKRQVRLTRRITALEALVQ